MLLFGKGGFMKSRSALYSIDFWFGTGSIIVFAVFLSQLGKLSGQVKVMPMIVMAIGMISAVIVTARSVMHPAERKEAQYDKARYIISGFVVFAIVALLLWFSDAIGMYLSLFLSLVVISTAISIKENGLNWKKIGFFVLYDLIVTIVLFIFFYVCLAIDTPMGLLI